MSDEKRSYQVTDRRHSHLQSEGEGASEERPSAEPTTVADRPAAAEPATPDPAVDFTGFLVSLATQAGMLLGGAEGEKPDLKGARWIISILEMLQDKTEGRRTPAETDALDRILYELRMAYVERSRVGGA